MGILWGKRMDKQLRKILCTVLFFCIVLSGCGKEQSSSVSSEVSCERNQVDSSCEDTPEQIIERSFSESGITNYEKIDLTKLEKLVGVSLEEYISYHFFYESDGLQIEAYISAPKKEIKSDSQAPCLIYNHGGNRDYGALTGTETLNISYRLGLICIASNYRGCGQSEGSDNFGGDDVNDVVRLVDLCEAFDFIDNDSINMLGASRGGMMTYETLRKDSRINRAIVLAGATDCFMTYEDRIDMRAMMKELIGATPTEDASEYEKRSATCWANEINTPLLIFHTTGDNRVSVEQADKLVALFEEYDKEYKYVKFESDVHCELREEDFITIQEWLTQ